MNSGFVNPPNLPEIKGTSHIFYKTRMCAKFLEGTCRNGEYCTYAHGVEDLREPPSNWRDLVHEKDREWNDDQKIIHRMTISQKFYKGEECPYGYKCNFLHERPNMPRQRESFAVSIEATGNRSNPVHIEPIYWKTKICSKWEITGQCPYRDRCHFAHGQIELQAATGRLETEMLLNSSSIAPRTFSLPLAELSFAHTVVNASIQEEKEEKKTLKWKRSKISGIYGDWIDDHVPPHLLPNNAQS